MIQKRGSKKIVTSYFGIYLILSIILFIQAFSITFGDESEFVSSGYFMAKGLIPHKDFIQPHNMFYFYFYLPIFIIFSNVYSQIAIRILSVILILISAYLIYKIIQKNRLGDPHIGTLFYLIGYTGLPNNFLRNEFFALFCLLLFFYFNNFMLKGIFLTLFGSSSIMFVFPTIFLWIYLLFKLKNLKEQRLFVFGSLIIVGIFTLFLVAVSYELLYWNLVNLSIILGPQINFPWYEVVFFSLVMAIPYFFFGIIGMVRNKNKEITKEVAILIIGIFSIIVLASIISGGINKAKLPSYMPALGLLALFSGATIKKRFCLLVLLELLTLFIYTPTLASINYIQNQFLLDSCVKKDAIVQVLHVPDAKLFLNRLRNSYYWYCVSYLENVGIKLNISKFSDPIVICGNEMEKNDFICSDKEIKALTQYCATDTPPNLVYSIRKEIYKRTGFLIKVSS